MFSLNPLSVLFLFLILLGVIPNLFYMAGYLNHIKRKFHFLVHYFVFILSMIGVVLSNEIIVFLFFWEMKSLSSWQLILTEKTDESIKAAGFIF